MQRKLLPALYIDLVIPLLCCLLLPKIAMNAQLKYMDSFLYEDLKKTSIFNSVIFGIAIYIACFVFMKLLDTIYLNIVLSVAIIFFLFWQLMPLSGNLYQYSFNYIKVLIGIYLSAMAVNSFYLLRHKIKKD